MSETSIIASATMTSFLLERKHDAAMGIVDHAELAVASGRFETGEDNPVVRLAKSLPQGDALQALHLTRLALIGCRGRA